MDQLAARLAGLAARVAPQEYERDANGRRHAVFELETTDKVALEKLMAALHEAPGISRLRVELQGQATTSTV